MLPGKINSTLGIKHPLGAGIYQGGDVVDFSLYSNDPDAIIGNNNFPINLDQFSFGDVTVAINSWADPFSSYWFELSIEDFQRPSSVPAPTTFALFAIGIIGMAVRRKMIQLMSANRHNGIGRPFDRSTYSVRLQTQEAHLSRPDALHSSAHSMGICMRNISTFLRVYKLNKPHLDLFIAF